MILGYSMPIVILLGLMYFLLMLAFFYVVLLSFTSTCISYDSYRDLAILIYILRFSKYIVLYIYVLHDVRHFNRIDSKKIRETDQINRYKI